jgi:hypothetical protein
MGRYSSVVSVEVMAMVEVDFADMNAVFVRMMKGEAGIVLTVPMLFHPWWQSELWLSLELPGF